MPDLDGTDIRDTGIALGDPETTVATLMDHTLAGLEAGNHYTAMEFLADGLSDLRQQLPAHQWRALIESHIRRSDLLPLIHRSPLAHRGFHRPRGYAGDAETLDYVYGTMPVTETDYGSGAILYHEWEYLAPTCSAIRSRRDLLADLLTGMAEDRPRPRVLSIACGHMREAQHANLRDTALYGLDHDADSLTVVRSEQPTVTTVHGSVRSLLDGRHDLGRFDLIYSAGLYDYLSDRVALRLTRLLFAMLRNGGRLVVANLAPQLRDAAYLEAFMDWHMIYRDERQLLRTAPESARSSTFRDSTGNIVFLELTR